MKDSGILLLTCFVALIAGCIGYGLGDGLARYESAAQLFAGDNRLQWEVLLTGLAAIAGGYMAYFGAIRPHEENRKAKIFKLTYDTKQAVARFMFFTDENDAMWKIIRDAANNGDGEMIKGYIAVFSDTENDLPVIPEMIASKDLLEKRQNVIVSLSVALPGKWNHGDDKTYTPFYPGTTRVAILEYLDAIEKHI